MRKQKEATGFEEVVCPNCGVKYGDHWEQGQTFQCEDCSHIFEIASRIETIKIITIDLGLPE